MVPNVFLTVSIEKLLLGVEKVGKWLLNVFLCVYYWGCSPCASPRLWPPLGSARSFCSEIWSSAELNKNALHNH